MESPLLFWLIKSLFWAEVLINLALWFLKWIIRCHNVGRQENRVWFHSWIFVVRTSRGPSSSLGVTCVFPGECVLLVYVMWANCWLNCVGIFFINYIELIKEDKFSTQRYHYFTLWLAKQGTIQFIVTANL